MKNKAIKIGVSILIIIVIGWAVMAYSNIFLGGDAPATAAVNGASSTAANSSQSSQFVLPALSADVSAQTHVQQSIATSSGGIDSGTTIASVPNVGASEILIANLQTGSPFYSLNADERWPMASVSKLMTAVVATNDLAPTQKITITAEMAAVDPTEHILHVGDTYTVDDLLRVMLLPSNNVAATALADFYGYANFTAAMNAQAKAWGMTSTYYDDPSGLSSANESTPNDLLKIAQHIYSQYPQILAITREPSAMIQDLSTGQPVTVQSINNFAGTSDFIGGKTGYTDQADGNLLSIFNYNSRPIFIVVLGIDDGVRFDATQQLFDWLRTNFK